MHFRRMMPNTSPGRNSDGRQPLVPVAAIGMVALRRCQHGQKWQGHGAARPRHRRQHHQAKPSQAAGFDEMLLAGAYRVTIDGSGRKLWSPSALNGVIDADHYRPVGDQAVKNQPQQAVANLARVPAGAVGRLSAQFPLRARKGLSGDDC